MRDWSAYVRERFRVGELRPERVEEIVEEIAGQLEEAYREALAEGLGETEAEAAATAHVTDWEALGAAVRESPVGRIPALDVLADRAAERRAAQRGLLGFFSGIWRDALYGLRLLVRNRGFAAAAILTMAIGIGANTAVFSILDATLFFPLPYPQSNRIVNAGRAPGFVFQVWARRSKVFTAMAADDEDQMTLSGAGTAERLDVAEVTAGFFPVFGIRPMLGRGFLPSETQPGGADVAILSYGLWQDRFGASSKVLGQTIHLNDTLYTVVGVMPRRFVFPDVFPYRPAALLPVQSYGSLVTNAKGEVISESGRWLDFFGRLRPDVSPTEAQADLVVISGGKQVSGWARGTKVTSLRDYLVGQTRPVLLVFWAAVAFVLLIACANLANLALARAVAREKEIAVRVALGAHGRRVARQLLTENVLLTALGGVAGVVIAYALVVLVRRFGPADIPRLGQATLNLPVLAFTALLAGFAGVLAGLAPARAAWRLCASEALKEGGRTSAGRGHRLLRGALVIAEIALALVLAIGAGLMLRAFLKLVYVPRHFDPHGLLVANVALPQARYTSPLERSEFEESLITRIERLPGVVAAAAAADTGPTLTYSIRGAAIQVEGVPLPAGVRMAMANYAEVSPGLFPAARMRIVQGRDFQPTDTAISRGVAIVNQAFVRSFLPHIDPLGRVVAPGFGPNVKGAAIVGVVMDAERGVRPTVYLPYAQDPAESLTLFIRAMRDPLAVVPALRAQVAELDKDLPVFDVATMDHALGEGAATQRFETALLGVFALVGLLLAALGVYGVVSYAVGERTHEFGVRIALGAESGAVMRMVLRDTLGLAFAGIAIGIAGALALTVAVAHSVHTLFFRFPRNDAWTFAVASGVLLAAALVAGFLPARRATEIDPLAALRHE